MIIDSSAIVAILLEESDALVLIDTLESVSSPLMLSAASLLETSIVLWSKLSNYSDDLLDSFLASYAITIAPVTVEQVHIARHAYRDFGKGSGSPARLNYGDCFSYALARSRNEPLLFTGNDFHHTDLTSALSA